MTNINLWQVISSRGNVRARGYRITVEDADNSKICHHCRKPIKGMRSASLTQWIFDASSCNCVFEQSFKDGHRNQTKSANFCRRCGKPVPDHNRSGTLTQWIFRTGSCRCIAPLPDESSTSLAEIVEKIKLRDKQVSGQPDDRAKADEELTRKLGLCVDRYLVVGAFGKGGLATVYRAWDKSLSKYVAIKLPVTTNWSKDQAMMFQQEARALSKLSHQNVAKILDMGQTEKGQPFIVLELIDGKSLAEIIQANGALDIKNALNVLLEVVSGINHVHTNGLLHRDLKPSNILVTIDGEGTIAKIIDFGLARNVFDKTQSKEEYSTTLAGSPNYMSPDPLRGLGFDARSDIYSFGCVMYECLTGKLPFSAESPLELLSLHANHPAPSLSDGNSAIEFPVILEHIVAKCLRKEPKDRYQTAEQLSIALDEAIARIAEESASQDELEEAAPYVPPFAPRDEKAQRILTITTITVGLAIAAIVIWTGFLQERNKAKLLEESTHQQARRENKKYRSDGVETMWMNESAVFFSTVRKRHGRTSGR